MKSIILSAQDSRELDKKKAVVVEKKSKPEAGAPYIKGEAVFVREPWKRLDNSEVYHFASDAVGGDTGNLYKWSSPLFMPAAAIRYYARVAEIERTGNNKEPAVWKITLEKVSKADAEIIEAGIPLSDAEDADGVSDYYTYTGDMSPEDREKMCAAVDADRKRLAVLRARRREINADPDGPADTTAGELSEIEREERDIVAALSDAGVNVDDERDTGLEAVAEPAPAGDASDGYSIGKCPFCGRAWSVGLATAPDVGYTTQKDADAAAGRICTCEGARRYYSPVVAVTTAVTMGVCQYCGQMLSVGDGYFTQRDADEAAGEICKCPEASRERRILKNIEDGHDRIKQLFGEGAGTLGFQPIAELEPLGLLNSSVELIARRHISSLTVQIRGYCKAKLSTTSKGKIKVERSEAHSCQLEAGE